MATAKKTSAAKTTTKPTASKPLDLKKLNQGTVLTVNGPVLDIQFSNIKVPLINNAILVKRDNGELLTVEVAQQIGDNTVRCVAMGPTEGLRRGIEAYDTGQPISVPVGKEVLGRMFNVLGEPIDEKPVNDK